MTAPLAAASTPPDDELAARLRGFGPTGLLAMLIILAGNALFIPLSGVLVLVWRGRSHTRWRDIGYARPRSWIGSALIGVVLGFALKLLMKAVVMPLLGAPPVNQTYAYLTGNAAALPGMLFAIFIGAGFGEETVFRGYLFERLRKLLPSSRGRTILILLLTSALFGIAHYQEQGLPGVEQGFIVGLVLATLYAVTNELWTPACVHVAFDLTAVALIYWNLETDVAHFFFG